SFSIDRRARAFRRRRHIRIAAACSCGAGHRPDFPEYPAVRTIERLAESLGCSEFGRAAPTEFSAALAQRLEGRARGDRPNARLLRSWTQARRAGGQSCLWRAAAA